MRIPVNPEFATTEQHPLDDSLVYNVRVTKFEKAENTDKNGNVYFQMTTVVVTPEDFQERTITDGYIPEPKFITADMPRWQVRKFQDDSAKFWSIISCFIGLKNVTEEFDTIEMLGQMGEVLVENRDFNGRKIPSVRKYLPSNIEKVPF